MSGAVLHPLLTPDHVTAYQRDGVVLVRGLFADFVEELHNGVERNMAEPGPYASNNEKAGETGRFFDDYFTTKAMKAILFTLRKNTLSALDLH